MAILFVSYTGHSEDIRRISLGLIRILIRCIFVWVKVVDEDWNLILTFSVICFWCIHSFFVINDWNNIVRINDLQIRKKIVLDFIFREILSIVYNFSFCCVLQRCRESPTWIFYYISPRISTFGKLWNYLANFKNFKIPQTRIFMYFSTNRRIW